jgi:hypothetical protein
VKEIIFYGAYGDEQKTVKLTAPSGGAGFWQLIIDNYYYGILVKRNNQWEGHINGDLTAEDILILGELIDAQTA